MLESLVINYTQQNLRPTLLKIASRPLMFIKSAVLFQKIEDAKSKRLDVETTLAFPTCQCHSQILIG